MSQDHLHLDFETASECDLLKRGLDAYASDASTRALMLGWAINDEPARLWQPGERAPARLREALREPSVELIAHNAQFERIIFERVLRANIDPRRWRCTMVMAYYAGLPGSLGEIGQIIGLPAEQLKIADGKRLMRRFSQPQKITKNQPHRWRSRLTDPEDWERFCEYCRTDVESERAVYRKLARFLPPPFLWEEYQLDQKINDRGMPVDMQLVDNSISVYMRHKQAGVIELKELTGLDNPMSAPQALKWLKPLGYPFGDMRKNTVARAVLLVEEGRLEMSKDALRFLSYRAELNKASVKKFDAIKSRIGSGHRIRFNFQFLGAMRTGRWAGRAVQLQNLARPLKAHESILPDLVEAIRAGDIDEFRMLGGTNLMQSVSSVLRPAFRAADGKEFRVSDLSAIEDRVVAWVSGCETILQEHRAGLDPYKSFGKHLYKKSYDELTKAERNNAKPGRLGCCYRLSAGAERENGKGDLVRTGLWGYAESLGVALTQAECAAAVKTYREQYPEVVQAWYALENAAMESVLDRRPVRFRHVVFDVRGPYLRILLPSGRYLHYLRPRIEPRTFTDNNGKQYTKKNLSYEGVDSVTKQWCRIYTHGGKLIENITQAIARDILMHGLALADKEGFDIVGHVHDEIITEHRISDQVHTLDRLSELMAVAPPWCPDLPLAAAGYCNPFYKKD